MNLKLVLQLSVFGLIMAFATVSLIPDMAESFFWLVIFIICAYLIAKRCTGKYFLHGFLTSIFNSIWITIVHFFFYNAYVLHHAEMAAKMTPQTGYFATHPPRVHGALRPAYRCFIWHCFRAFCLGGFKNG